MGSEDMYTGGGHSRKPIDPQKLRQMKERWKESETIRELSTKHHQEHEVPKADEELLKDLDKAIHESRPVAAPQPRSLSAPNRKSKKVLWIALVILVLITAIALFITTSH